jgi:hypothetical protein
MKSQGVPEGVETRVIPSLERVERKRLNFHRANCIHSINGGQISVEYWGNFNVYFRQKRKFCNNSFELYCDVHAME